MSSTRFESREELLRAKRKQMREDPRMYMRYNWNHPNRATDDYDFRTNEGEPLHYLVDDKGPLNPNEWGSINVFLMARGCLKTTSMLGVSQWTVDCFPQSEVFMTAPRQDQVSEFMGKFRDQLADTPLEDRVVRDRMSHQKFESRLKRDDGDSTTVFSHVKAQSAWDADNSLRGPHSHVGIIDEVQDVDEEAFGVFLEIIDQGIPGVPHFPCTFLIGTPKLKNTFFHKIWQKSNQRTWDGDAQEWIDQDETGEYAPEGFDGESFSIKGWHIDQPNSPLHDEARIEYKREDLSEKQFKNEVLAQFYSPEDDLLSDDQVRAIFDDERGFRHTRQFDDSHVVVSVDWGGGQGEDASDTVFVVGELVEDGDDEYIIIQNIEFIDHDVTQNAELEKVRDYISKYEPDRVVVDEGYAGTRRESLQEDHFDIVKGMGYGNVTPSESIKWRTDDHDKKVFATVDKTYNAELMVDMVKDGGFVIPKKDLQFGSTNATGNKVISQLTAPYKEFDTTPSGTKKLKIMSDRRDDLFDTAVMQVVGHKQMDTGHSLTSLALNDRF